LDSFTDIGKGGAVAANVSAVIDRVTVDVLGQAHLLGAIHEISESLEKDDRYVMLAEELLAIRDVLERIASKESRVEVHPAPVVMPEIKFPENRVQVFPSLAVSPKIIGVLIALASTNLFLGIILCLEMLRKRSHFVANRLMVIKAGLEKANGTTYTDNWGMP